ncbi:unnamed protein product [Orchesella dallaii]|uniref:G-protein coupled receptors family 1 profile domain-containing protein n=1 Tax=Orchesella dallaii TaxID=48710 RepID=A0ABP1Q1F1_9HEXA
MDEPTILPPEYLHMDMCHMIDLPPDGRDCSHLNESICIECTIPGKYLTGESMTDYYSAGHIVCLLVGILTVITGLLGLSTNLIIIGVLKRRKKYLPFDFLLVVLACCDLYCCATVLIAQTARMALYGNWVHKGYGTLEWYMASTNAALFGRTASTYMTLLITTERFCIIAFPFRCKTWFTSFKTKLLTVGVLLVSIILNVPRFINFEVTYNSYIGENAIASVGDYEYLVRTTAGYDLFYRTLGNFHGQIDFWGPLPILLLFNALSFIQARKITRRRKGLNRARRREIEGLRLFLPVVVALFATNLAPFIHFVVIYFTKTLYRELSTAMMFSIAINAAVNFHLYYYQNSRFKKEADHLMLTLRGIEVEISDRTEQSNTSEGL